MNSNLFSPEWISEVFSDLWSLHLTLIGCFVSVFTLLYSFIIAKKGDLKLFTEQFNRGENSPTLLQRQKFAANYIKRMRRVANFCLLLLSCSILSALGCWVGIRFLDDCTQKIAFAAVALLTSISFALVVYLCHMVLRQYFGDIRI